LGTNKRKYDEHAEDIKPCIVKDPYLKAQESGEPIVVSKYFKSSQTQSFLDPESNQI
jgi:hypothetical protein